MTNAMETLYNKWIENYTDSPKVNKVFDLLCVGKDLEEINSKYYMLADVFNEENRTAFEAGFYTALELMKGYNK